MRARDPGSALAGAILIDKPEGLTSHDVVDRVRRMAPVKRCGHTGTLDPFATGLIVLCLGRATRLARFISERPKTYVGTLRFGYATDTYDRTGRPVGERTDRAPTEADLRVALQSFAGVQEQTPPPFSAKKIQGRRAYELARAGVPVVLDPVRIEVHTIELVTFSPPTARVRLRASSGTYVRSIAHDLGLKLGTGAHLETLRRTSVGLLGLDEAITLEALGALAEAGRFAERVLTADEVLRDLPALAVETDEAAAVAHGRSLSFPGRTEPGEGYVRVLDPAARLIGVAEAKDGLVRPVVVWAPGGGGGNP